MSHPTAGDSRPSWQPQTKVDRETKARAIERAKEIGPAAASRELGLPRSTMYKWMGAVNAMEREAAELVANPPAEIEPIDDSVPWSARRARVSAIFGHLAEVTGLKAIEAANAGRAADAKGYAVASAVAVDKSLLLAGEATTRSESLSVTVAAAEAAAMLRRIGVLGDDEGPVIKAQSRLSDGA